MSAQVNSAVWRIAVFGAGLFLLLKLFPTIKAALTGNGGGGPVASGSGGYGNQSQPFQGNQPQSAPPQSGGGGNRASESSSGPGFSLANWINNVLQQGWNNAATLGIIPGGLIEGNSELNALDQAGLQPLQLQDLGDLPVWDPNDPNAPGVDEEATDIENDDDPNDYQSPIDDNGGGDVGGGDIGGGDIGGGDYGGGEDTPIDPLSD